MCIFADIWQFLVRQVAALTRKSAAAAEKAARLGGALAASQEQEERARRRAFELADRNEALAGCAAQLRQVAAGARAEADAAQQRAAAASALRTLPMVQGNATLGCVPQGTPAPPRIARESFPFGRQAYNLSEPVAICDGCDPKLLGGCRWLTCGVCPLQELFHDGTLQKAAVGSSGLVSSSGDAKWAMKQVSPTPQSCDKCCSCAATMHDLESHLSSGPMPFSVLTCAVLSGARDADAWGTPALLHQCCCSFCHGLL